MFRSPILSSSSLLLLLSFTMSSSVHDLEENSIFVVHWVTYCLPPTQIEYQFTSVWYRSCHTGCSGYIRCTRRRTLSVFHRDDEYNYRHRRGTLENVWGAQLENHPYATLDNFDRHTSSHNPPVKHFFIENPNTQGWNVTTDTYWMVKLPAFLPFLE
jgi:hypothetical protein